MIGGRASQEIHLVRSGDDPSGSAEESAVRQSVISVTGSPNSSAQLLPRITGRLSHLNPPSLSVPVGQAELNDLTRETAHDNQAMAHKKSSFQQDLEVRTAPFLPTKYFEGERCVGDCHSQNILPDMGDYFFFPPLHHQALLFRESLLQHTPFFIASFGIFSNFFSSSIFSNSLGWKGLSG